MPGVTSASAARSINRPLTSPGSLTAHYTQMKGSNTVLNLPVKHPERRHLLRDRRHGTTACPAGWAMVTNKLNNVRCVKRNICTLGRLEQPRQEKNLLYRHDEPNEPTKEGPLSYVLLESHLSQFNSLTHL
jgi:hypothetical protein